MQHAVLVQAESGAALWREIRDAADAITTGERDAVANMANVAAVLFEYLPDVNWVGFYRLVDGDPSAGPAQELVLGPFQGKAACIRIAMGSGVCGTAAATRTTQRIEDVHAFPGHIACDAASRSELVVPIVVDGSLIGVLDLDSPLNGRFTPDDAAGAEALVARLGSRLCP